MKKITILIPVISLFLFSCGNTSKEKPKEQTETVTHKEHQHDEESEIIRKEASKLLAKVQKLQKVGA